MNIWHAAKKLFGFKGVGESALRIVDKITGTDWTPKAKAEFILKYQEATKHQSVTRRVIAIGMFLEWGILVNSWLISTMIGRLSDNPDAILLAADIQSFMGANVNLAINAILAFYFLMNFKK